MDRPYEACSGAPSTRTGLNRSCFWTYRALGATIVAVPDYGRYCPVALGTEVLADRWTPLVVRELTLGNTRFNDIARALPGISRSLLTQRLRHLERAGVLERWPVGGATEYRLTPAGEDLGAVVFALGKWAIEWRFDDLHPEEVDPVTLMWWMHRRVDSENLPPGRVVIEFRHTAPTKQVLWMLLDRGEASVCVQHPGFDPDLVVSATTGALSAVFNGVDTWRHALSAGTVAVEGRPALARALPRWFLWSPFADITRERAGRS
jgi:DNA-binding HxlR family transcriptional regulator